jgi:ADP-ribose pyrophosphatase
MSAELEHKQVVYDGKRLRLEIHHFRDDAGHLHQREVVIHPGSVVICPIKSDGSLVLIRNRRAAAGKILIELPAGTLEKGEMPINCAGRELLEETGYLAGHLQSLLGFYTSPGLLSEFMHAYLATQLHKQQPALDEGEEIELLEVSYEDALRMIRFGDIQDAKTIAALLAYDRFFREPTAPEQDEGPIAIDPAR